MSPEELIQHAHLSQGRAKALYSHYAVGAALLIEDNTIILGCNIESKAYPTTLCAERVAIFSALAQGNEIFNALNVPSICRVFADMCNLKEWPYVNVRKLFKCTFMSCNLI